MRERRANQLDRADPIGVDLVAKLLVGGLLGRTE